MLSEVGPYFATLAGLLGMLWFFVRKHGEPPPYLEKYLDAVTRNAERQAMAIEEQTRVLERILERLGA
jgi:hypothetical protein